VTPARARAAASAGPARDCPLCPRLAAFRAASREREPSWFNAPVPSFGAKTGRLLIVGLAPGLKGANRTGRPFTGDFAGDLLYATMIEFGFARGDYRATPADGLELVDARIANAVRCVPPENKPTPPEIRACNPFLAREVAEMPRVAAILALGRVAHDAVLAALDLKRPRFPFAHGAEHRAGGFTLFDSYHCSRYNTNTGVLTPAMFRAVFRRLRAYLDGLA
jgi:uracil-DNA glycosylase family 4